MNTRISAIATSVYVLVTVMPRYSRSILSSILQGKPRSGGTGAGTYTENGTQYPGLGYSEVNTPLAIDASGISGPVFAFVPRIKTGQSLFQLRSLGPETGAISARTFRRRCCRGVQISTPRWRMRVETARQRCGYSVLAHKSGNRIVGLEGHGAAFAGWSTTCSSSFGWSRSG
jgi:hypothetical protein